MFVPVFMLCSQTCDGIADCDGRNIEINEPMKGALFVRAPSG